MDAVLTQFEKNWEAHLEELKALVRIPSVSFEGFDPENVRKSASAVADLLKKRGLNNVEIIDFHGCHPYVYGEHLEAGPDAPTLLLYAHHDVQPPGREEVWLTPPFEPTMKEGPGGMRMYARGSADDKAGIIVHVAAITAFLEAAGTLPVNVKVVIEGEEEIGSHHLLPFLKEYRQKLDADVLVLTDTANFDCGVPGLTVSLRGLVGMDLEVRALKGTLHSGLWGGPVPDPAMALSRVLGMLTDDHGRIAVPGLMDDVKPLSDSEKSAYEALPYDADKFKTQTGMVGGAQIQGAGVNPWIQIWRQPSLSINGLVASDRNAGNVINDSAWARITVRTVANMEGEKVQKSIEDFIRKNLPWGLEVSFNPEKGMPTPWLTEPKGPAFEAAHVALEKGYGVKPVNMGCGGSIPFVQPFAEALDGAPALLIGVEDPYTNAHGENESLLVDDLKKACHSQIHLFIELAERLRK